jgi:tellurium resistance protein TerD
MAINLQKGQRKLSMLLSLPLALDGIPTLLLPGRRLTWTLRYLYGRKQKDPEPTNILCFTTIKSPDGAVEHTGDNLTGDGDGDDEQIKIDLW